MLVTNVITSRIFTSPSEFKSPHSSYPPSNIRVIIEIISSIFNIESSFKSPGNKQSSLHNPDGSVPSQSSVQSPQSYPNSGQLNRGPSNPHPPK